MGIIFLQIFLSLLFPANSNAELKGRNSVAEIDEVKELVVSGEFDKAVAVINKIPVAEGDFILYLVLDDKEQMVQTSFPKKSVSTYISKIEDFATAMRSGIENRCKVDSASTKFDADITIKCLTDATKHLPTISPSGPLNQATFGGIPHCTEDAEASECSPLGAMPGNDLLGKHITFPSIYSAYVMKYLRDKISDLKAKEPGLEKADKAAHAKNEADAKAKAESPEAYKKEACITDAEIKMAKKSIAEEKDAAKYSGVVDKSRMYRLGQVISADSRRLPILKKQYQSKTGKEWSPTMCEGY